MLEPQLESAFADPHQLRGLLAIARREAQGRFDQLASGFFEHAAGQIEAAAAPPLARAREYLFGQVGDGQRRIGTPSG